MSSTIKSIFIISRAHSKSHMFWVFSIYIVLKAIIAKISTVSLNLMIPRSPITYGDAGVGSGVAGGGVADGWDAGGGVVWDTAGGGVGAGVAVAAFLSHAAIEMSRTAANSTEMIFFIKKFPFRFLVYRFVLFLYPMFMLTVKAVSVYCFNR